MKYAGCAKPQHQAIHLRHNGKASTLMADGHCQQLAYGEFWQREPNYGKFFYGGHLVPFNTGKTVLVYQFMRR